MVAPGSFASTGTGVKSIFSLLPDCGGLKLVITTGTYPGMEMIMVPPSSVRFGIEASGVVCPADILQEFTAVTANAALFVPLQLFQIQLMVLPTAAPASTVPPITTAPGAAANVRPAPTTAPPAMPTIVETPMPAAFNVFAFRILSISV